MRKRAKKIYQSAVNVIQKEERENGRELSRLKARRETTREVLILCIMYGPMPSSSLARDHSQLETRT